MCRITTLQKNSPMTTSQWKSNQDSTINLIDNEQKVPAKSSRFWLAGAFASAFVATFCCLPALLFLIFGTSFGLLSILAPLEKLRFLFSVLALASFAVFIWARFYRKHCGINRGLKGRRLGFVVAVFLGLILLLFYPEILGFLYFYE